MSATNDAHRATLAQEFFGDLFTRFSTSFHGRCGCSVSLFSTVSAAAPVRVTTSRDKGFPRELTSEFSACPSLISTLVDSLQSSQSLCRTGSWVKWGILCHGEAEGWKSDSSSEGRACLPSGPREDLRYASPGHEDCMTRVQSQEPKARSKKVVGVTTLGVGGGGEGRVAYPLDHTRPP